METFAILLVIIAILIAVSGVVGLIFEPRSVSDDVMEKMLGDGQMPEDFR